MSPASSKFLSPSSRIFVTGGSGFVGGHLIEALVTQGHTVLALARSERSAAAVEGLGARAVRGDLCTVAADALEGVDAVVHCAALAEDWGPRERFEAVNVQGTRRLLEAAAEAGVQRFLHLSSEAVHFSGTDLVDIDEDTPLAVDSPYAYSATKAKAEQAVVAANRPGFQTIVLRPRLIWGPRDTTILPVLAEAADKGAFTWVDGGSQRISTTHVHNLTDAILAALDRAPAGLVAFVVDAEQHTARSFLTAYAAAAGVHLPNRSLPGWLVRGAAGAMGCTWKALRLSGKPPVTPFSAAMLSATVTIRSRRAAESFGWTPSIDLANGLARVAAGAERPAA